MARPQNMDEVKRQIEQVLVAHTAPGTQRKVTELPRQIPTTSGESEAGEQAGVVVPVPKPANLTSASNLAKDSASLAHQGAAHQVTHACGTTATDIENAAEVLLKVAQGIAEESHQLAELLRKHGKLIANRIEEFTAMTQRVALKMREARADVMGSSETDIFRLPGIGPNEAGSIRVDKPE